MGVVAAVSPSKYDVGATQLDPTHLSIKKYVLPCAASDHTKVDANTACVYGTGKEYKLSEHEGALHTEPNVSKHGSFAMAHIGFDGMD